MNASEIRDARNAHPFARFTLELRDGTLAPVERAFQLAISPSGGELTYARRLKGFEHFPVTEVARLLPGIVTKKAG
jgi:hypothetical protein